MKKSFHLTKIAASMSLVLGSGFIIPVDVLANSCTSFSDAGTCGLTEFTMSNTPTPVPTAWYFTSPTQDAAINGDAKAQNIYFASGMSGRTATDIQQLLVDGANLEGYYINASKTGSVEISLKNKSVVDWVEAGALLKTTNTKIIIDDSVINGANAAVDYDKTNAATYSKYYARGNAILLDSNDLGSTDIDILNGSKITGQISAGGAGKHDITLQDSAIVAGAIKIANSTKDNNITVLNSNISTTGAVLGMANAIDISNSSRNSSAHTITIDKSQLTGSVNLSSNGSTNVISVKDSAITNTTLDNAITLARGASTQLNIDNGQIKGHTSLSGTGDLNAIINDANIDGNLIASQAARIAIDITRSVLSGEIDASTGSGTVALHLTDSSVEGDVNLSGGSVLSSDVWLNNSTVLGHLYGSGQNSTLHLAELSQFDGAQFSQFSGLNVSGDLTLMGGFSDANVGTGLTVKGGTLTAPVNLTAGNLVFDQAKLVADTLSLQEGSSLAMNNKSQLQTRSDQLFTTSASDMAPEAFSETGMRLSLADSTLILSDDTYHLDYVKAVNSLINTEEANTNTLVMLGTLQNADNVAGTATVADASTAGAVLANTQVTSGKNTVIIGRDQTVPDDYIAVRNGFGAAQLLFEGVGNPSVSIEGNQSLTLTGAMGGALIDVVGAPDTAVDVTVDNGVLNLGTAAINNVTSHLNGNITINTQGTMNVDAGEHSIISGNSDAGIISSGLININNNATLYSDVKMDDTAKLNVTGSLQAGLLAASEGAQITVGNAQAAGLLVADRLDLQGATMFIDPAWVEGGTLADASRVISGGNEINGRMTVGQNSLLILGDTSDAATVQHFAATGLTWGSTGTTAALAIQAPQTLSALQGGLRIDGALTGGSPLGYAEFNTAEFADHSLLMVNSKDMTNGKAALSADQGSLKVADSAALYVADAKANQTYVVTQGFDDVQIAANGWQNDNLLLNKLLYATTHEENGQVMVSTHARAAKDVLPGVVTTHALDTLIASGENSLTAPYAGQRFLSVAVDTPQVGVEQVVKNVNSAAQMAIAGDVQSSTLAVGTSAINAILDRNSVTNEAPRVAESDASLWVQTLYGNQRSRDQHAGVMRYGNDSDFYGLMMGADKEYETSLGLMRSGVAFHAGNGDSDSRGDFNATHNDFSFWGASLYQNWRHNALNITGEVSLTQSSNDLYQKQPEWLGMGDKLKANVDSQLFSIGVQGQYLIETNAVDIIPHVGARYNQLVTQSFDTKSKKGENIFHTEKGTQNIWQFPVGVKVNKTFALDSGWNMSTQADVGVIAVAGDRSANSTLHTVGVNASDVISADVMDSTAFNGQAGLKFQKGNMTFGLGYTINASSHDTGQAVSATYKLAF